MIDLAWVKIGFSFLIGWKLGVGTLAFINHVSKVFYECLISNLDAKFKDDETWNYFRNKQSDVKSEKM